MKDNKIKVKILENWTFDRARIQTSLLESGKIISRSVSFLAIVL